MESAVVKSWGYINNGSPLETLTPLFFHSGQLENSKDSVKAPSVYDLSIRFY